MTRRRRALCAAPLIAAGLLLSAPAAWSAPAAPAVASPGVPVPNETLSAGLVRLRAGDHAGFGRLVLDLPPGAAETVATRPGAVSVSLAQPSGSAPQFRFGPAPAAPRGTSALTAAGSALAIALRPGVVVRRTRLGDRLILDFVEPAAAPFRSADPDPTQLARRHRAAVPSAPSPAPPLAVSPVPVPPLPASGQALSPSPPDAVPAAAAETAPGPFMLPVRAKSGLAGLVRGKIGVLVADADAPADAAAWRAIPPLAKALVTDLPGATLVTFPLPSADPAPAPGIAAPDADLSISHGPDGWSLAVAPAVSLSPDPQPGIELTGEPPRLLLGVVGGSRVVSVADPLGGGTLLVGTVLAGASPSGAAPARATLPRVVIGRTLPVVAVLPTAFGVAIEPKSDTLDMRAQAEGFELEGGLLLARLGPLPPGGADDARGTGFSRCFDLPPLPLEALINRRDAASATVAATPARARAAAELRLAETLLALGLGVEAQAVLRLAAAADGRVATDPRALALGGAAALLAGRLSESDGLESAPVAADAAGTDEIALWRALRSAALAAASGSPAPPLAARTIAARQAIVLAYPLPLRRRLLPLMAETLVGGGEVAAARRLIGAAGQAPGLDYARALLDIGDGRINPALARLDRLASQPERSDRARASVRAVELRLSAGRITPRAAADGLEKLIDAWRGDLRELAVRLRAAELRTQAGEFRPALALLRETDGLAAAGLWPAARRQEVRDRMAVLFAEALARDEQSPLEPLAFVSLVEDNADLLPTGPEGERVAARVADRLAALDLPQRAEAALRHLVEAAPAGAARAALGARLASTQLREEDAEGALLTLSSSTAQPLPETLAAERTMIFARATAARGDIDAASGALASLDTPEAAVLRGDLLEKAGRWPEAVAALERRVAQDVPSSGEIPAMSVPLVLRLATAASEAGRQAILDQIRTELLPRMAPGTSTEMLRVLTEDPVRGVSDLPRAAQEAALIRSIAH